MKHGIKVYALLFSLILLGLLFLVPYVQLNRELPNLKLESSLVAGWSSETAPIALPWPSKGSAAVSVAGAGYLGGMKDDRPQAIASLVKVMTAYVALKDHPLKQNEAGPLVKVQAADVQNYRKQLNNGESVVLVKEGTDLSEADLLDGLLIPSGNNYAYMLAQWSAGSVDGFVARMNEEAAALGMTNTRYADPSGLDGSSVSTAHDQVLLAEAAMANPVLANIVGQKQASLPDAGLVFNVNSQLVPDSLSGIKTGWTEQAGACFLFAADRPVGDHTVRIYGAVLGQDTLADAFGATRNLIGAVTPGLAVVNVVSKATPAGALSSRWGTTTAAMPAKDVNLVVWPGTTVEMKVERAAPTSKVKQGDEVGKIVVTAGPQSTEVPLVAQGPLGGPSIPWRVQRLR